MNKSVVILGRIGSPYTNWVIEEAFRADLPVSGILLQVWDRQQKWQRMKHYARKHGWFAAVSTKIIEQVDHMLLANYDEEYSPSEHPHPYRDKCAIYEVPTLNGKTTLNALDQLQPSVLILAGVGIVNESVISRAQSAVINAHPGLVPQYKGNYVVRWAIFNGDEVGITVHLVDKGIDTGPVLSQHVISLPKSNSLLTIEHKVDRLRAKELVTTAKHYLDETISPQVQPVNTNYPTYTLMPPSKLIRTYLILRKLKANLE